MPEAIREYLHVFPSCAKIVTDIEGKHEITAALLRKAKKASDSHDFDVAIDSLHEAAACSKECNSSWRLDLIEYLLEATLAKLHGNEIRWPPPNRDPSSLKIQIDENGQLRLKKSEIEMREDNEALAK